MLIQISFSASAIRPSIRNDADFGDDKRTPFELINGTQPSWRLCDSGSRSICKARFGTNAARLPPLAFPAVDARRHFATSPPNPIVYHHMSEDTQYSQIIAGLEEAHKRGLESGDLCYFDSSVEKHNADGVEVTIITHFQGKSRLTLCFRALSSLNCGYVHR